MSEFYDWDSGLTENYRLELEEVINESKLTNLKRRNKS